MLKIYEFLKKKINIKNNIKLYFSTLFLISLVLIKDYGGTLDDEA